MILPYRIVDVFAQSPLGGNPLAVVDCRSAPLSVEQRQLIANEFNLSETTFVYGEEDVEENGQVVKAVRTFIHTPKIEMQFAGHPTLGTAHVLLQEKTKEGKVPNDQISLALRVGVIPVQRDDEGLLWMKLKPAQFHSEPLDVDMLSDVLGVKVLPGAWVVSCGSPKAICPVSSSEDVRRASVVDERKYVGPKVTGLYVFTINSDVPNSNLHSRFFAPFAGVPEDAATGSAAGPIAAWLVRQNPAENAGKLFVIAQGEEMGRKSRLYAKCEEGEGACPEVGGRVFDVMKGEMNVF